MLPFWLVAVVALNTLRVAWRRFLAADAEFPLVRGEDTEDEEEVADETPDVEAAVAAAVEDEGDGAEERRFRNSASFAARA